MHSYTGFICFPFPHCVFSNVSSNHLPERMHSHIGCICLTFLHCAFSNVSSKCLPERMHSRIGCICLAFLHCVLSNVSSNRLHERMHSCTGCICLLFPHRRYFQLFLRFPFSSPVSASPNGYFLILRQILGFRRYKISVEKQTNATSATMHPLMQAI